MAWREGVIMDAHPLRPPVMVLAFNRPEELRNTLRDVCAADPPVVYVNVDGPRDRVPTDAELVAACVDVVHEELRSQTHQLRQHTRNQGLGFGAREALSWFFAHEESGVVLEDDIRISPGSLDLAGLLLHRFATAPDIGSISLFNAVPRSRIREPWATYRFSAMPSSWYWGTWRSRWAALELDFTQWRDLYTEDYLKTVGGARFARLYAGFNDDGASERDVNWEGAWIGTHFANSWKSVYVNGTLGLHVGYSDAATHLVEQPSWQPTEYQVWDGTWVEPSSSEVDTKADFWMLDQRFVLSRRKRAKTWLGRRLPLLRNTWRRFFVKPMSSRSS